MSDFSASSKRKRNVFSEVRSYVLMIPILYLATTGSFSFEHVQFNNMQSFQYGYLYGTHDHGRALVELALVYSVILIFVFSTRRLLDFSRKIKEVLILPLIAITSCLWSQDPLRSGLFGALSLFATLFAVALYLRYQLRDLMKLFLLVGVVSLVSSSILALFYPAAGVENTPGGGWGGLYGFKGHLASGTVYLMTPALCSNFSGSLRRLGILTYISASILLILMTRARTGWLMLALVLVFVGYVRTTKSFAGREKMLLGLMGCAWAVGLVAISIAYYKEIALMLGKSANLTNRIPIWTEVLKPILKRPWLGYGYSAFWIGFKGEAMVVALAVGYIGLGNAENGVLQMWLELGLLGIAVLMFILFRFCYYASVCAFSQFDMGTLWCMTLWFLALLALVDGAKFMLPNSLDWVFLVIAYLGLRDRAQSVNAGTSSE